MTKTEWMNTLTEEGYVHLNVCSMEQETDFGEHTHDTSTVHVILRGSLTMTDEKGPVTINPGERFNIQAGTTHTAKCGPEGLEMIVGIKQT